ncbi:sporulation integral membrane protein YlbJ [Metabacillus sp. RGM 3146]|uniref:sporulation integral membrane protein YlbJ n=1 Tax=Metabacillus sp. RGM 3146 TaxID=3401092 RepID=UPI003B99590F
MNRSKWNTLLAALFIASLTLLVILHPEAALDASKQGLKMWWEIVFPSLLPFFILSELLIAFGIVQFIGIILEPFMRPIFRVPGVGGFVFAMGMASGFPSGAKLTARLRQENQLSAIEAERLVSFTNCSNPLFIFGAVAVGFFHNQALGLLLAAAHYLGNVMVGLVMRFHGRSKEKNIRKDKKTSFPSILSAFNALHKTRLENKQPLGKMLGNAVLSSVQSLLMIGGFIIAFSVFNRILSVVQLTDFLSGAINVFLTMAGFPESYGKPLISGLFEITLGSQLISKETGPALLFQAAVLTSFILAFSGFSVQAQVASILAETDIRFKPFFIARIMQGFFAAIAAALLFKPLYLHFQSSKETSVQPAFLFQNSGRWFTEIWQHLSSAGPLITIGSLLVYIILYSLKSRTISKKPY